MRAVSLIAPILVIMVSVPLILNMVPRNRFYGFRTPRTRSSDEIWYPANRFSGITLMIAGIVWLVCALIVPELTVTPRQATLYPLFIGISALLASLVASLLYVSRL